jgi:hypothetical protein
MPTWNYFSAVVLCFNKAQCMPTDRKPGFQEAKNYHEKLTQIDIAILELVDEASRPMSSGGFNPDHFNSASIALHWRKVRNTSVLLPSLINITQNLRFYDDHPLPQDPPGPFIPGGERLVRLLRHRNAIDRLIRDYDAKNISCKEEICDTIDQFSHYIKDEILNADRLIIENASALATVLADLSTKLGGRNVR